MIVEVRTDNAKRGVIVLYLLGIVVLLVLLLYREERDFIPMAIGMILLAMLIPRFAEILRPTSARRSARPSRSSTRSGWSISPVRRE